MSNVKLIGQVCMHNEMEKGNLERCLENLRLYCDEIVIYDDASTDNSIEIASCYTSHIIRGEENDQMRELQHKQLLLDKALSLGATYLWWLDCDEVLDRPGAKGGLRNLCEHWPDGLDAYSFKEINLWRSQTWARTDTLFTKARFVRLWKVTPGITFDVRKGVHLRLYPVTINFIKEATFGVLHYGFWDYKKMMVKIGAHRFNDQELRQCAANNWILDERACSCYKVPDKTFPPACLPPDIWSQPAPRTLNSLEPYPEVAEEREYPLVDSRNLSEWESLHAKGYHGSYDDILKRNKMVLDGAAGKDKLRINLFQFSPEGKTICDIGAGGGWHGLECIVKGAEKVHMIEADRNLIGQASRSFFELGIGNGRYQFISSDDNEGLSSIPQMDIIYCMAVFQHIPWWQAQAWLKWIGRKLKPGGETHLQFYFVGDETMFWNNDENVTTARVEREIGRVGLKVRMKRLAEGKGVLPVWNIYECTKEGAA